MNAWIDIERRHHSSRRANVKDAAVLRSIRRPSGVSSPRLSVTQHSRHWLVPVAEILTVGLPFCVFKVLTGLVILRVPALVPLGYALIALGVIDTVFNAVNLGSLALRKRPATGVCLSDFVLRRIRRTAGYDDLGSAVDVFLSFALVAAVIGLGLVLWMPRWALSIWNVAVVLNVLGAGVGRLVAALGRRDEECA